MTNTNRRPPRGALVFWGTQVHPSGHVAVSLGNWLAVGTRGVDGQQLPIQTYGILSGPYPSSAYLGWVMPLNPTVEQNAS